MVETPDGQVVLTYPSFNISDGSISGRVSVSEGAEARVVVPCNEVLAVAPFTGEREQAWAVNDGREIVESEPDEDVVSIAGLEVGDDYLVEPASGSGSFRAQLMSLRGPLAVMRPADGSERLIRLDGHSFYPID